MVSGLWGTTWYRYLTNVLAPPHRSAREVCELDRRRWRIEETFWLTKRRLGLSYLWVGAHNGVEVQLYATWLFYAVLSALCVEVALTPHEPLEQGSVERGFRSLDHFARAIDRGENPELVPFLMQYAKLFGLVKATRKRHKERPQQEVKIWGSP
jgi:hypothetical protein